MAHAQTILAKLEDQIVAMAVAATLDWYLGNEDCRRAVIDGSYRDWVDTNNVAP